VSLVVVGRRTNLYRKQPELQFFLQSAEQPFATGLRPVRSAGRIKVGAIDAAELGPFKK